MTIKKSKSMISHYKRSIMQASFYSCIYKVNKRYFHLSHKIRSSVIKNYRYSELSVKNIFYTTTRYESGIK
jgi:hypothetical protein